MNVITMATQKPTYNNVGRMLWAWKTQSIHKEVINVISMFAKKYTYNSNEQNQHGQLKYTYNKHENDKHGHLKAYCNEFNHHGYSKVDLQQWRKINLKSVSPVHDYEKKMRKFEKSTNNDVFKT